MRKYFNTKHIDAIEINQNQFADSGPRQRNRDI